MKYPLSFALWWQELSAKGDPQRRPDLVQEAFDAGFKAGWNACGNKVLNNLLEMDTQLLSGVKPSEPSSASLQRSET